MILLVGNFLSSAGANLSVGEQLAERLNGAGYSVITTSNKKTRVLRLIDMVVTTWARRCDYQTAYVEVYSGVAFLWAEMISWVLKLGKKNYALALHGGNLPTFAQRHPERVRRLLQAANSVIVPSQYLLETMRPYRPDIRLIPNPIELAQYPFRVRANPAPRLVWLRAFHTVYNPQMAVRVVAALHLIFPDIHMTMIGPDKADGTLQATQGLIEGLSLGKNIAIVPGISKSDVPRYLERADIFINTTNVDNAPVSILEAMACGLCVVSTNVGGIPFLVEDKENALLVSSDDPQAMSSAVQRIIMEPGLSTRLSTNARCKAEQFDWSVVLPQWERLFLKVIHAR
jgi:glycosyltransferase involved in cell wall biosynthesis